MLPKALTSLQHPIIKRAARLRKERRERAAAKEVLVPGLKMLSEVGMVKSLFVLEGTTIPDTIQREEIFSIPLPLLKKITGLPSPEPFAGIVSLPEETDLSGKQSLLILDSLGDPGNVGTLIRTALALGWEGVFLLGNTADPFNDRALRASKGAIFRFPYRTGTREEFLSFAKVENLPLLAADMGGKPASEFKGKVSSIVLGNEARGLSEDFAKLPKVSIPMSGKMESLNVAAAGAILLYELGIL